MLTIAGVTKDRKRRKKVLQTIMVILLSEFLIIDQIFLLPQLKLSVVISIKHGAYDLSNDLQNELRLRNLRKLGNIRKI